MRSLSPSNAADMLANMVSPPIAGTSLATRIVALGGFLAERLVGMPDVSTERRIGLVVAKFDQNRDILILWRERMNGEFTEPAAKVDQILRADVLVAKYQQLVLRKRILNCVALLVRHRLAQVDAGDLGPEMSTHPRDRQPACSATMGRPWKLPIGLFMMSNSL